MCTFVDGAHQARFAPGAELDRLPCQGEDGLQMTLTEKAHRNKLGTKFRRYLNGKRIVCLDIPDEYDYMDPDLIALLKAKVSRHLPSR